MSYDDLNRLRYYIILLYRIITYAKYYMVYVKYIKIKYKTVSYLKMYSKLKFYKIWILSNDCNYFASIQFINANRFIYNRNLIEFYFRLNSIRVH